MNLGPSGLLPVWRHRRWADARPRRTARRRLGPHEQMTTTVRPVVGTTLRAPAPPILRRTRPPTPKGPEGAITARSERERGSPSRPWCIHRGRTEATSRANPRVTPLGGREPPTSTEACLRGAFEPAVRSRCGVDRWTALDGCQGPGAAERGRQAARSPVRTAVDARSRPLDDPTGPASEPASSGEAPGPARRARHQARP